MPSLPQVGNPAAGAQQAAPHVVNVETVLAQRVRELRKRRGFTQGELADRVNAVLGTNWYATTVAKIEGTGTSRSRQATTRSKKRTPSAEAVRRTARAVSMTELLALAISLNVSPESLLLPRGPSAPVDVGGPPATAHALREWLAGRVGRPRRDAADVAAIDTIMRSAFGDEKADLFAEVTTPDQERLADYVAERGDEIRRAFAVRGVEYLENDLARLIYWLGMAKQERRAALEVLDEIERDCQMIRSDLEGR